jgi:CHAT domain-containing protein
LHEAQQQLGPDLTVLSYFTTPETTLAFVVTRDSLHVSKLPVTEGQLYLAVTTLLDFSGEAEPPSVKLLHKSLIAPIKSHLKTSMVAVVPHGILHDLPFAALTPDGKQYLSDSYSMFYLPSVSVLPYIRGKTKPGGDQILVLANDKEEGLSQLRHANNEAREVASVFGAKSHLGDAATASTLLNAGNYDILHLIAHIDRDSQNPQFSRIITGPGKGDEGPLELHQVFNLDLRKTNLVVLSGWQSEMGWRSRGGRCDRI